MKFFKLRFRKGDIFIIPLCMVLFGIQYYFLTKDYNKELDKKLGARLDKLAIECRAGKNEACKEYTEIISKSY